MPVLRAQQANDPTSGLVSQFSNQNLGGSTPRAPVPAGRDTPGQFSPRPPRQSPMPQQQPGQHLTSAATQNGLQPALHRTTSAGAAEELPPKNPGKYSDNVYRKSKLATEQVSVFFKENVQRAKDRNLRFVIHDLPLSRI